MLDVHPLLPLLVGAVRELGFEVGTPSIEQGKKR
jgi:hypothetical protein